MIFRISPPAAERTRHGMNSKVAPLPAGDRPRHAIMSLPLDHPHIKHVSAQMSLRYGKLFDATVRTEYERALTLAKERIGALPEAGPACRWPTSPAAPWKASPLIKSRLAGGFCLRAPAQGACAYANICEHCPNFRTDTGYLPVLAAQRADTQQLAEDAEARGWISEATRHRELITRLDALIARHKQDEPRHLARAEDACSQLAAAGQPVTFTAVAARANISRGTLYRDPALRTLIDEHRHRAASATLTGLADDIAALRTAIEAVASRVRRHEEQLRQLRRNQAPAPNKGGPVNRPTENPKIIGRLMPGQRPRRIVLRLAQRRADRSSGLADPGPGPPRGRRVHRLVQRHPAAQHPRLPQSRRIRSQAEKNSDR